MVRVELRELVEEGGALLLEVLGVGFLGFGGSGEEGAKVCELVDHYYLIQAMLLTHKDTFHTNSHNKLIV